MILSSLIASHYLIQVQDWMYIYDTTDRAVYNVYTNILRYAYEGKNDSEHLSISEQ